MVASEPVSLGVYGTVDADTRRRPAGFSHRWLPIGLSMLALVAAALLCAAALVSLTGKDTEAELATKIIIIRDNAHLKKAAAPRARAAPKIQFPMANSANSGAQALAELAMASKKADKQATMKHSGPADADFKHDPYDKEFSYPTADLARRGDLWRNPSDGDCGFGTNC